MGKGAGACLMPSPDALALRTPNQTCDHEPNCGCRYAGCCFECPLPECKYIVEAMLQLRRLRARKLFADGVGVKDIAADLGVCRATVRNYLRSNHS